MNQPNAAFRKSYSRFCPKVEAFFDGGAEGQRKILGALIGTVRHFFGDFSCLYSHVTDLRNSKKIRYPPAALGFAGVLMYLCHLESRRQVGLKMRTAASRQSFQTLFGMDDFSPWRHPQRRVLCHGPRRGTGSGLLNGGHAHTQESPLSIPHPGQVFPGRRRRHRNNLLCSTPLPPLSYPRAQRQNHLLPSSA